MPPHQGVAITGHPEAAVVHAVSAPSTTPAAATRSPGATPATPPAPSTYVNPGEWLDTPIPADVAPQLPEETLGRALG